LVGTQEVGDVCDSDCPLTAILDRFVGAGRREGLDSRGVEPSVHDSPWLVMAFVGGDRATDARPRALVELDIERRHETRLRG
jgi:hypothetical protein